MRRVLLIGGLLTVLLATADAPATMTLHVLPWCRGGERGHWMGLRHPTDPNKLAILLSARNDPQRPEFVCRLRNEQQIEALPLAKAL